ncbi:zf-HC2 domain-containing protein [bacterium]|nr:zf-HC2 domain-containing protein [bacterium]
MSVEKNEENLIEYLDGTISKKEKAEFEEHLGECESCRQALKDAQDADSAFRSVREFPSPDLAGKILKRIESSPNSSTWLKLPIWSLGPALAFCLFWLLWGNFSFLSTKKPDSVNGTSVAMNATATISLPTDLRNEPLVIGVLIKATGKWSSTKLSKPGNFSSEVEFQTEKDGRVTLRIGRTHDFKLLSDSLISVSSSAIQLKRGGIWCETISTEKPGAFPLRIGDFIVKTIGTKFGAVVKGKKLWELALFDGKVRICSGEKSLGEMKNLQHVTVFFDSNELHFREIVQEDYEVWKSYLGSSYLSPSLQRKPVPTTLFLATPTAATKSEPLEIPKTDVSSGETNPGSFLDLRDCLIEHQPGGR